MVTQPNRRDFLRGAIAPHSDLSIRPPGWNPETFRASCKECSACLTACPQGIIEADESGQAVVNFTAGECTFCGGCAEVCPTGALEPARLSDWPWRARISQSCLSANGITCRTCQDACEPRAIRFRLQTMGRALPELDEDACTGCGACATSCPVGAVSFENIAQPPLEAAS